MRRNGPDPAHRGLPLLIRLARQAADERRGEVARAEALVAEVRAALDRHERRVEAEGRAAVDPGARAAYPGWIRHAARYRADLATQLERAEREEARRRDALRDAFAATKRLELAAAGAEAETVRCAARRAQAVAEEQAGLRRAAAEEP